MDRPAGGLVWPRRRRSRGPRVLWRLVLRLAAVVALAVRIWVGRQFVALRNPARPTAVLFVKFHKVGGTTTALELVRLLEGGGHRSIEEINPIDGGRGNHTFCVGHKCSLTVAESMLHYGPRPGASLAARRRRFRASLEGQVAWMPRGARLLTFTVLREPAERLRSRYYFQRGNADNPGWCVETFGDRCAASRLTFLEWMNYTSRHITAPLMYAADKDYVACCEYTRVFGGGKGSKAVSKAIHALELFDVVGLTERLDESLARMRHALAGDGTVGEVDRHAWDNAASKKAWTDDEWALARQLTAGDRAVYEAAVQLFEREG